MLPIQCWHHNSQYQMVRGPASLQKGSLHLPCQFPPNHPPSGSRSHDILHHWGCLACQLQPCQVFLGFAWSQSLSFPSLQWKSGNKVPVLYQQEMTVQTRTFLHKLSFGFSIQGPNKVGILSYTFHFKTQIEPTPENTVVFDKVQRWRMNTPCTGSRLQGWSGKQAIVSNTVNSCPDCGILENKPH
jgi:hypothetical protein